MRLKAQIAFFIVHRSALFMMDVALRHAAMVCPPLSSNPPKKFSRRDVLYLCTNAIVEHGFMLLLLDFVGRIPLVSFFSLVRVYALLWADDILYGLLHRCLHERHIYPLVHAHHHIQKRPHRGYADAGNENPIEQVLALSVHMFAMHIVRMTAGIDGLSVVAHLIVKSVGSCLNHVDRAVIIHLGCGVTISSQFHQEHHMKGCQNFTQFLPCVDRLYARAAKKCHQLRQNFQMCKKNDRVVGECRG